MDGDGTIAGLRGLLVSTTDQREIVAIINQAKGKLNGDDDSAKFVLALADKYTDLLDLNCHRLLFEALTDLFMDIYRGEHHHFAE